ncbi:lipase member H-like [Arctopsyche grandis]|uniref:lipase member H-like n=1 Tax=Arctopsyche grandis TaxID=121162 RepID=UPI00406DA3F1
MAHIKCPCLTFLVLAFLPSQIIGSIDVSTLILPNVAPTLAGDCPMNYDDMAPRAIPKLQNIILSQHSGSKKVDYHLGDDVAIRTSPLFNGNFPTVIVIPGFNLASSSPNWMPLVSALNGLEALNLFVVDHSSSTVDSYYVAAVDSYFVGIALGEFLSRLYSGGVRHFHLIGYSLGAHMAGVAGQTFKNNTLTLLDRISGLDPAGPCFRNKGIDSILDKTDATFVDIIHTDMNNMGIPTATGHVDFFPNSGMTIVGCLVGCGHSMSPYYYAESITRNQFLALKCTDWRTFESRKCTRMNNPSTVMGYWTPTDAVEGNYYLRANFVPSYSKAADGIQ